MIALRFAIALRFVHAAVIALFASAAVCIAQDSCAFPAGFKDTPYPPIGSAAQLVSRNEQIVIARPFAVVSAAMDKPLHEALHGSGSLPGVSGEHVLTGGEFGAPGSRRIVCLSDGTAVEEQSLEREENASSSRFKYVVWNYSTPKARPIAYGVGEFRTVQIDDAHTRIDWTYSFQLKGNSFPGNLGALGRWLFKVSFLDRDYADMMRGVLEGYKESSEAQPVSASRNHGSN